MYVKYDKYKVIFKDSGLSWDGSPRQPGEERELVPGYISLNAGENPEDYKDKILDFYKKVFYGQRICGIERFEPLTRQEIKEKREMWGCGFKMFKFKPEKKAA